MAIGKIGLANTLIETGDYNQAHRELKNADLIARKMNSHLLKFQCQAGWALIALEKGDEKVLFKHLRLMTSIGKNHDLVNTPFWRPSVMSRLFAKALEYGIEVDYSRAIIRKRNLLPPEGHKQNLNNWPWPLQVSTLGTFKLVRNGKAVRFSGKSQKKPMELLKALIAFGGKEVSVPKLLDFLWPDSDGDMAQNSFNAALHRLRNLVGIREAIALQDGMLSLDPRYCWVDLWAFEGACEAADQAFGDDQSGGDFLDAAQRAIDLFTGHFLPDDLTDWAVFPRERIRNRYWKVASRLGRYLEKKDENEKAIEYYLKALDIDDLSEEAYIKLMNCYERVGRKADALILYERCKKTLDEVLGVEPSPEMEIIYRRIRS
jgi:DNA-binding SARP family transcriptional activator